MGPMSRKKTKRCRLHRAVGVGALAVTVSATDVFAQACPSPAVVVGTSCTVPPGTTVNVTTAGQSGHDASNPGGQITADGVTVNLGAAATTAAVARDGAIISFNGSTVNTTSGGAAATSQFGLRATGSGSQITATGALVNLANTTGNSNSMAGISAETGGVITLTGTSILVRGGTNGIGNHGVQSIGGGSVVRLIGGSVTTQLSRGSFGVAALAGGMIDISSGTQIAASGIQTTGTSPIASHALFASGVGSAITGTNMTASASGTLASGALAESGASITLSNSTISTAGAGNTVNPAAGLRAVSGGALAVSGSTVTTSGQFGHGLSVQGAGSRATLSDTAITVSALRSFGVNVIEGAAATITGGSVLAQNSNAVEVSASTLDVTNASIRSTVATGAGIRYVSGSSGTINGGSSVTEGRDGPGLFAAGSVVAANNLTITTTGTDNAMGVLADLGSQITMVGGSVSTSGDSVRAGARAHGFAARNPGGTLIATGTVVRTQGSEAMGVVADDGGSVMLSGVSVTTGGTLGLGLFSVVEQLGAQFPAAIVASNITVETSGARAYGGTAQQNFLPAPATILLNNSSIVTHGDDAMGLRALSGGTIVANQTTVRTEGLGAHGIRVRDNPSSVTLDRTSVLATGALAHGAVVEGGGLLSTSNVTTINATGAGALGLLTIGAPGAVPTVDLTGTVLTNQSAPTIGVAGPATISLTRSIVGGSGQWLVVGTSLDLPPLTSDGDLTGIPDLEDPAAVAAPALVAALPVTPGLANITLTNSIVSGSALTLPGSVSNVVMNGSVWNMTGNSNLTNLTNNRSLIAYSPPSGDLTALSSYKTLTVVNYVGQNGFIGLNTYLGQTGSPSDRLVIDSGIASGQSALVIRRAAGNGAVTVGDGILVVNTINGGTTNPGSFTLALPVVAGPYEYTLHRSGSSNDQAWFLRSVIDCSAQPQNPGCVNPVPVVDPDTGNVVLWAPNYRPEVSLFTAVPSAALIYGRRLLGTLHERMGDRAGTPLSGGASGSVQASSTSATCPSGETCGGFGELAWMRLISFHGDRDGGHHGIYGGQEPSYHFDMTALQVGSDLLQLEDENGRHHFGLYGAYGTSGTQVTHATGVYAGNDMLNAWAIGAYWTWYGTPGWYLDAVLQGVWYDFTIQPGRALPSSKANGFGFSASLEAGHPFNLGGGVKLEPQLQLVYQTINLNQTSDLAAQIQFGNVNSLAGRAGLRVTRSWELGDEGAPRALTTWMRSSVWNEFLGRPTTSFSSDAGFIPFTGDISGAWGEINLGVDAQFAGRASFYASGSYLSSFNGDRRGWDAKIGVKYAW